MNAIFVTGATGTVGSAVVEHLLARGEPVVAAVRGAADAANVPTGAETRRFDFGAPRGELRAALDGCDRLFLLRPPAIADVERYLFPLVDVAREAGVAHVVFLSLQGVAMNRGTPHHAVEAYLRKMDVPYTFLRPNFFAEPLDDLRAADPGDGRDLHSRGQIEDGVHRCPRHRTRRRRGAHLPGPYRQGVHLVGRAEPHL